MMQLTGRLFFYLDGETSDRKIVKDHLQVLELNTWYDVYTILDDFTIVQTKGCIKSNESWNYHNNYDDSENEMYVKHNGNEFRRRFFLKYSEVKEIQKKNIEMWKKMLNAELERLDSLT